MTIRHHPSDETLAAFAGGSLDVARRIVVASHIERCDACHGLVRVMERAAGVMLEDMAATPMAPDALERTLSRLDGPVRHAVRRSAPEIEPGLPASLRGYKMGPWRWVGFGVRMRSIDTGSGDGARAFLLKGAPGIKLPQHTHTSSELTSILAGSYSHEGGRFAAGDFEDADEGVEHRPIVGEEGECLCLVALEGRLRLTGFVGALLNPFVRL